MRRMQAHRGSGLLPMGIYGCIDVHNTFLSAASTRHVMIGTFICTLCGFSAPFLERGQRLTPDPDITASKSSAAASNIV